MLNKLIIIPILFSIMTSVYSLNTKISSPGSFSIETLSNFLASGNSKLGSELTEEFASIYIDEAKYEGINWDVAFIQMCLETGFLNYGGLVNDSQNNFCGLGSFDNREGASFPTIREGVRAHIQHLKAYSSTSDLNGELNDPRFHLVKRGSVIDVMGLAGTWAEDPEYGVKLTSLLKRAKYLEYRDSILVVKASPDVKEEEPVEVVPVVKPVAETKIKEGWLR